MDCLARAFSHATRVPYERIVKAINHPPPYHIQEIIEVLGRTFSITELSCRDIDPSCPFEPERIKPWLSEFSGVLAYWHSQTTMHAVAYNHKNNIVTESDGSYCLPVDDYTIFWIIQPRPFQNL